MYLAWLYVPFPIKRYAKVHVVFNLSNQKSMGGKLNKCESSATAIKQFWQEFHASFIFLTACTSAISCNSHRPHLRVSEILDSMGGGRPDPTIIMQAGLTTSTITCNADWKRKALRTFSLDYHRSQLKRLYRVIFFRSSNSTGWRNLRSLEKKVLGTQLVLSLVKSLIRVCNSVL